MRILMVMAACLLALGGYAAEDSAGILGVWVTPTKDSRVEVKKAADGTVEGRIVWLKETVYPKDDPEAGVTKHDRHNPDASKRDKPIIGLAVVAGFKDDGGKVLKGGTVYNPRDGKTYSGKLTLKSADKLEVRGFIGISLLGASEEWTRYKPEAEKK